MKNLLGIFVLIIMCSCTNEETNIETTEDIIEDTLSIIDSDVKVIEDTINQAVQENPLAVEDIPNEWYRLNKQGEGFVINEYCEAETQKLSIEYQERHGWRILVSYGQDSQWFKIIEFEAYEEKRENFEIIYGTFIIENPDYPDSDPELYDFMWNKDLQFATFGGFFQEKARMVSIQNKNNYELIKENCDYLNEDQER
ncbi:MAG: hypothetical protein P1U41_02670 [Vicingaceae bacterium]|nr:hypothetical protein [Vicingaceae bacterium]